MKENTKLEINHIYNSKKYGDFKILNIKSNKDIHIKFITTGYEKHYSFKNIINDNIKDRYFPSVYGVGFLGEGKYNTSGICSKMYRLWISILRRCYDINQTYYYLYGGKGVTVDKHWHNFQNFCEDIQKLENYDEWINKKSAYDWTFDKDKYSKEYKVYSKDTCWFTDMRTQNLLQNTKKIFGYIEGKKLLEFNNIDDAANYLNISNKSVSNCLTHQKKSAGKVSGNPVVLRYEDDYKNIIYKRGFSKKGNYKFNYNGYVNGEIIFKKVTIKEMLDMDIIKNRTQILTSCNKNTPAGKYNEFPIIWKYAEE